MILTLKFDPESQARFEEIRRRYFPPERNQVPAHLTLFHQLPNSETTRSTISGIAQTLNPFSVAVTGLRSLGRGTAFIVASGVLLNLHAQFSEAFSAHLIPQDRQAFRPHVVVQNKVDPGSARAAIVELDRNFVPYDVLAVGLDLWLYQNGPWLFQGSIPFTQIDAPMG